MGAKTSPEPEKCQRGTDSTIAAEFGKLIVKLRWIGAEADANAVAGYLAKVASREIAIVSSGDTD